MILLIRDNECFEPRVQNYINYFKDNNVKFHVIAWNRTGDAKVDDHITFYERRAEYGKRIANIPNKLLWMRFVMKQIFKHRAECRMIHACDIDAVLPALFMGKLVHKVVVFDIFDWISSLTGKGFVYKITDILQNYAYKHSDAVILCEEERKAQANTTNEQILVLPNIPRQAAELDKKVLDSITNQKKDYELVISYVGVFDRDRGLENLLECISKRSNILLNIAGFGVLDEMIKEYSERYENICYWGRVEYQVGQTIMKSSHLIAAMYHLTSPLHKYAAPNKYYESLILGVPMITTKETLVGEKVKKYDTGFIIGEEISDLENLLDSANLFMQIDEKRIKCERTWKEVYCDYFDSFMKKQYFTIEKNR